MWILVLAALGLVVGIDTYGYNIVRSVGVKMTKLTPSRGYCVEVTVALVVAAFVFLRLPISMMHCVVSSSHFDQCGMER